VRVLYFDCFSGAAGDMILAALLDAGASEERVRAHLEGLGLAGWDFEVTTTDRGGFRASRAQFHIDNPDHTRTYPSVAAIVERATLPPWIRERSLAAFSLLAEAEARVHGVTRDAAHFHEVGADDAILDVVASFAALADLGVDRVFTSPIATGVTGTAMTSHGLIPIPAPATAELLSAAGATMLTRGTNELITPTGAAILAAASHLFGDLPPLRIERVGYGAGAKELEHPNLLRAVVGSALGGRPSADAELLETNLDDLSPELLPHVIDALLTAGAHDAWVTPVVMKKGRPGFVLSVLGPPERHDALVEIVFSETSTLGLRTTPVDREVLDRDWMKVEVEGLPVRVKLGRRSGRITTAAPEHDDAAAVARATGLPLKAIYERALRAVSDVTPAPPSP
jgi:pyridinium-3,5-bisthiocarboxylic acid mononucleotide nickel chelatase